MNDPDEPLNAVSKIDKISRKALRKRVHFISTKSQNFQGHFPPEFPCHKHCVLEPVLSPRGGGEPQ